MIIGCARRVLSRCQLGRDDGSLDASAHHRVTWAILRGRDRLQDLPQNFGRLCEVVVARLLTAWTHTQPFLPNADHGHGSVVGTKKVVPRSCAARIWSSMDRGSPREGGSRRLSHILDRRRTRGTQ
jgi:hypothetical protein